MKTGSRPQYYRIRRMVQMVREGAETGSLPNSSDFMREFEVSRRTVARDLDFLRDEERAPLAYDDARHGFRLTDPPSQKLRRGTRDLHAAAGEHQPQGGLQLRPRPQAPGPLRGHAPALGHALGVG